MQSERQLTDSELRRKEAIIEALHQHKHVGEAARSLGIGKRRLYRMMKRLGISLKAILGRPSLPPPATGQRSSPMPEPQAPTAAATRPERDTRRLTVADFRGPSLGDVGAANYGSVEVTFWNRLKKLRG